MPSTYKICDALVNLGVSSPLGVNSDGAHAFECLRLLTGTVNLEHKSSGEILKLRRCHLTQSQRKIKSNTLREVIQVAFNSTVKVEEISGFLKKTISINRGFWEGLVSEICLALACEHREKHVEAFLHIYRILEMSSVALPLFYATSEYDYNKALYFLKGLPSNPRDGDLAILKKFSKVLAIKGGYQRYSIEIPYSKGNYAWDTRFADQLQNCVVTPEKLRTIVDVAGRKVEVPFEELPSFIISFRNRLFHNTLSIKNFDLDSLGGADPACEPLVKPALNWITLTLCVILQQAISRYI